MMLISILLIFWIRLSLAGQTQPFPAPKSPKSSYGDKFIVQLDEGCTGILIARDWILSAAHCTDGKMSNFKKNKFGDNEKIFADSDEYGIEISRPKKASSIDESRFWTQPIQVPFESHPRRGFWRLADRLISHGQFQGEALSWKGFDLVLIHLSNVTYSRKDDDDIAIPVCLAEKGFPDLDESAGPAFIAGFGRRYLPHCFTDQQGPEAFEVCGRPKGCSHNPRTSICGIEFVYQGQTRYSCLFDATPSASDPYCVKLRQAQPELQGLQKKIHLFDDRGKYKTTCYPEVPEAGSRGWCVTRPQGVDENSEPSYTKGWGFCSNDPAQAFCQNGVARNYDLSDKHTTVLEDEYCVDKLEKNLLVEQPNVKRIEYDPLLPKSKVICIGRNYTTNFKDDLYYSISGKSNNGYQQISPTSLHVDQVIREGQIDPNPVDGGPSCFGDSGGPLWRLVRDPENGDRPTPVLIGVFSYMLWGTCIGRNEPGYFGRVIDFNDWIFRYVPREEVCTFSKTFNDREG